MKRSFRQSLGLAALGIAMAATRVGAQVLGFGFSATPSTESILVGNSITYTINVTNQTGLFISDFWVTNSFSTPVTILATSFTIGNSNSYTGQVFTNNTSVLFDFQQFSPANLTLGTAQATFTIVPQPLIFPPNSFLTNEVVTAVPGLTSVPNISTNVLVQVTNNIIASDLAVSMSGFGQDILTGDTMTYRTTVTNLGPATVPNVVLTNMLPAGTRVISLTPTNLGSGFSNGVLVLNLGTLTNSTSSTVALTVQPTNVGLQTFSVSVGAANLQDPNPDNNTFRTNINIGALVTGQVIATNVAPMTLDPQTGLMDQTVRLINISTSTVSSVRLIVSNLTNWLYNAVGTNNFNPFVVYAGALNVGQSVDLVLEYFVPTRVPIPVANSDYLAVSLSEPFLVPAASTNGAFSITRAVLLSQGNVLIEFPSILGASYSILYSTNVDFSNSLVAQPGITAPGDRVQWIDNGPPKTVSPPLSTSSRFYRVIKN